MQPLPLLNAAPLDAAAVLREMLAEAERWHAPSDAPPAPATPLLLWTLLDLDGAEFVHYLYQELLDATPDPDIAAAHQADLAHGLSKIELAGRIRYSQAGRRHNRKVPGLLPRYLARRAYRVPILGRLVRVAVALLRLPALAAELHRARSDLADCQARLAQLERQAGGVSATLLRLQQAELRLTTLEARPTPRPLTVR